MTCLVVATFFCCLAPPAEARATSSADPRIVFWYDDQHPLDTFRYQVYRADQYTPAVDAWLVQVRDHFPHYRAYIRTVDPARAASDTRNHAIGQVILQEFMAIGNEHG